MPTFVWKGKSAGGEAHEGEIEAANRTAATALLRRQRIIVRTLTPKP